METSKKTLLILAGGLGSRYKGLKQIEGIHNGHSILEYSIFDALRAGFDKFVFIINAQIPKDFVQKISEILQERDAEYHWIIQEKSDFVEDENLIKNREKPWGTGQAVLCTSEVIGENFVVINADDLYGKSVYEKAFRIINSGKINSINYASIPYPLKFTVSKNGSVSRGKCSLNENQQLDSVVELFEIYSNEEEIYHFEDGTKKTLDPETLVSMNFWILHPSFFEKLKLKFQEFLNNKPAPKKEFLLPTIIDDLIKNKEINVAIEISDEVWKGITYPEDKAELQEFIKEKISQNIYPENLWS